MLIAVIMFSALVYLIQGNLYQDKPLDQLARRSLSPEVAFLDGKPTLIEFYADWCEVCRAMAPSMLSIEEKYKDQIDIVLLNVDNPRWQYLIDKYNVLGIPQMNLFDVNGESIGTLIGKQNPERMEEVLSELIKGKAIDKPLLLDPMYASSSQVSSLSNRESYDRGINPLSHS